MKTLFRSFALTCLVSVAANSASAAPIAGYEGTLTTNVTRFGQVATPGFVGSPNDDFWSFSGNAGDVITLTANRLESQLDPGFSLYFGIGSDTTSLTYLGFQDDDIAEFLGLGGPYSDPQFLNYILPTTGQYTVQVMSVASGSPGNDNVFDYQITLGTPPQGPKPRLVDVAAVPEPASMALLGLGLLGLAATRKRKHA